MSVAGREPKHYSRPASPWYVSEREIGVLCHKASHPSQVSVGTTGLLNETPMTFSGIAAAHTRS